MTTEHPVVTIEPIEAADIGRLSHFTLPPEQAGFADLPAEERMRAMEAGRRRPPPPHGRGGRRPPPPPDRF